MREERARLVYEAARRHRRGDSIRSIARALGIARKTVRRMLDEVQQRRDQGDDALARELPSKRAPRASKLDPFTDDIAELIGKYPDIRAKRLHEELTERGFCGGYTIVRVHLKTLRPKSPKKPRKLVRTGPGKQGQFDWSPYKLEDGTPIYLFSCVLSFSRFRYARFCTDMRQATVFRELRRAFEHFGGVADQYVTDSMPGIVDRWELEEPVLNLRAVDFAVFYDFGLHIAPRGDGAYKGKIERIFRHVDESFFNARTFHTLEEANTTMRWWLDNRCNGVKHGTTGRKPIDALADEAPLLTPLPAHRYDDRELAHRIVDAYCYVAFDGNHYLAPTHLVGKWIYIRASDELVEIVADAATVVARHARAMRNAGAWVPPPEQDSARPRRRPIDELMASLASWGAAPSAFASKLREHRRCPGLELSRILELRADWAVVDIIAAIEHAAWYQNWRAEAVKRILVARYTPRTPEDHLADAARNRIRGTMAQSPVKQRALKRYARLLAGPVSNLDAPCETDDDQEEAT